jgi:hypothetical protein
MLVGIEVPDAREVLGEGGPPEIVLEDLRASQRLVCGRVVAKSPPMD